MYERYEQLLQQHGVLTADVCRATGISQQVMSTWKKRRGGISAKNATKIAEYFGVSVAYLMGETEDPAPQDGYYIYGETARAAQELEAQLQELTEPVPERDLSTLKWVLSADLEELYWDFSPAEKRRFWRAIIKEIRWGADRSTEVIFL